MPARSAFLVGATALACAGLAATARAAIPLQVGAVLEDDSAAVLYGVAAGLFTKEGLDVHVERMGSGSLTASAVAAGSLQIGKSSVIALVTAFARGIPLTIIAPSALSTPQNPISGLLVRDDSPLRTGSDFAGKTFGVVALVDARVLAIKAWVDANGGDSRTLKFVEVPGSTMLAAVEAQRVDAVVISSPLLETAIASGKVRKIADPNLAVAPRFVINAWFTMSAFAKTQPDVIRHFDAALRAAAEYANAHPVEMATYLAPFSGIPVEELRKQSRSAIGLTLDPREYQPVIDDAAKYGFIPKPFAARDILLAT